MIVRCIAALLALLPATAAAADAPARIVSINLCADELLLSLADPAQIVALSPYAADPTLSFLADKAKAFRHDAADAETVIGLKPDLVLAGRFTKRETREMLTRLGYRIVLLDAARSIADSVTQIRDIAKLVGHPERGETLVNAIAAARKRVETEAAKHPKMTAAVYQRRGYVTGADTLTGELLGLAGFINAGGALAGKSGGFVPLEKIVVTRPDYIVVAPPAAEAQDQGSALLSHPALVELYPPSRRIVVPEKLTVCGGPSLPAALVHIAGEAQRVAARP
jgi:iron complex transport system substrate-binding protein